MKSDDDKTRTHVALTKGTMIAHYRIVEKIGAGGMGEVYLADDTELDRKVALKFLPQHLCDDEDCRKRFKREAQAAAKLSHPNIVTIHEVGEYRGRPFFVMEHVEGQSLKDFLSGKDLSVDQILELGTQICEGLQAAHDKGIIHRDVKPSNILIDSHGRARIVDFGLASVAGKDQLTKTGSTLGTIGYMSPEQVQGKEIDHRSDLFSLGVVLYELITKQNPFRRDNEAATLKAVSEDIPHPMARYRADAPGELETVIDKALDKNVRTRYQHADGMLSDLMRAKRSLESGQVPVSGLMTAKRSSRVKWAAAALILLAAAMVLIVAKSRLTGPASDRSARIMLAVLPFENLGEPQDDYFAEGMTEEITTHVARLSGLGVVSRTSVILYRDRQKDLPEIGKELGVDYILEGTVRWDKTGTAQLVRVSVQLIRVSDNTHVWAENYERTFTQIFAMQEEIASRIGGILDIQLLEPEQLAQEPQPTDVPEAYQAYLRGLSYLDSPDDEPDQAVRAFEKAIEYDSGFALAYVGLLRAHTNRYGREYDTSGCLEAAKEAADMAIKLQPNLPEAHLALAGYYCRGFHDYEHALSELAKASKGITDRAQYLKTEAGVLAYMGKFEAALKDIRAAHELKPNDASLSINIAELLMLLRRYSEAMYFYDRSIALDPNQEKAYLLKARAYHTWSGDLDQARAALEGAPHGYTMIHWNQLLYEGKFTTYLERLEEVLPYLNFDIQRGWFSLFRGEAHILLGQPKKARLLFDSALVYFKSYIDWQPNEDIRAALGRIYAWQGRKQDALREGQAAVDLCPIAEDAVHGSDHLESLARIQVIVGEFDDAIENIEYLLSIPSALSVSLLRLDPRWAPLRDHPRFQALIQKYEKQYEI